jgi:ribosomal protein S18 acetylase RimI-like enzyme
MRELSHLHGLEALEIIDTFREAFPAGQRAPLKEVDARVAKGNAVAYAMRIDGRVAAFAIVQPMSTPGFAYLEYFAVAPHYRGRGLGTKALKELTAELRNKDLKHLLLEIEDPRVDDPRYSGDRTQRHARLRFYRDRFGARIIDVPYRAFMGNERPLPFLLMVLPWPDGQPMSGAVARSLLTELHCRIYGAPRDAIPARETLEVIGRQVAMPSAAPLCRPATRGANHAPPALIPLAGSHLQGAAELLDIAFPDFDAGQELRSRHAGRPMVWEATGDTYYPGKNWVAIDEDDGRVVGTVGLFTREDDRDEAYWLDWFAVHPEARGRGLGGRMLEFAVDTARNDGKKFLRLNTDDIPLEKAAQHLYESHGLKVVDTFPWKEGPHNHIVRELRL